MPVPEPWPSPERALARDSWLWQDPEPEQEQELVRVPGLEHAGAKTGARAGAGEATKIGLNVNRVFPLSSAVRPT